MTIDFVRLTRDDLPLLSTWFEQPHVRRWWLDANSDPDHLEEKYGPRIDGAWPEVFVVNVDGDPVGFIQWCPMENYAEWYGRLEEAKGAIGIDYLIGEPDLIGRGPVPGRKWCSRRPTAGQHRLVSRAREERVPRGLRGTARERSGRLSRLPHRPACHAPLVRALTVVSDETRPTSKRKLAIRWPIQRTIVSARTSGMETERLMAQAGPVTPRGTGTTLASLLDMTNAYLAQRLQGLSDEEWLWEPAPVCWSIRDGKMDFALPVPSPAPVTTIAWRLHHIQACNEVELHSMQDEEYDWADVKVPLGADEAVEMWRLSAHALRGSVAALSDVELETMTKQGLPRMWFAATLVRENIHHGAEIGVLRDLYRNVVTPGA